MSNRSSQETFFSAAGGLLNLELITRSPVLRDIISWLCLALVSGQRLNVAFVGISSDPSFLVQNVKDREESREERGVSAFHTSFVLDWRWAFSVLERTVALSCFSLCSFLSLLSVFLLLAFAFIFVLSS